MILKRLFENYKQELSPEEALKLILSKGMPYLNEVDGKLLYSGRNDSPKIFKADYRTNRKPMTTSMEVQNKLDDAMKKMGIEALRSNSIFLTLNYESSKGYGKPMLIFPLGEYNYHWYYGIGDLTILYKYSYKGDEDHDAETLSSMTGIDEDRLKEFMKTKLDSEYATLSDLVDHDLLTLEQYEAIVTYEEMTRIDLRVNSDLDDWIDENDDRGHHELVLNSSEGYLAIAPEYFVEEVLPMVTKGLIDEESL